MTIRDPIIDDFAGNCNVPPEETLMPGKPDMRQQCHLAIDDMPDSALGEALERLRFITDEHEFADMMTRTWASVGVTAETDEEQSDAE